MNAESLDADRELVIAVQRGDAAAYRGLVERYQNKLYHVIYGMVRNQEDARDLTQDAFIKAFKSISSFRAEAKFYTWIYRIGMNLAIDHLRKRKRRDHTEFDEQIAARDSQGQVAEIHQTDSPRKSIERKQIYSAIMSALETLPEQQKQVVLLRELEGLSYKEIADIVGIPEGTVMSRLYYARKKLQGVLADLKN